MKEIARAVAAGRHAFSVDLRSARVSGQLDTRFGLRLSHLPAVTDRILSGEGHTQTWGANGLARWGDVIAAASMFGKDHLPILDEAAYLLLRSQQPNGIFQHAARFRDMVWRQPVIAGPPGLPGDNSKSLSPRFGAKTGLLLSLQSTPRDQLEAEGYLFGWAG